MKQNKKTYNFGNLLAAILMALALLWLTISTPFVYAADQQLDAYSQQSNTDDDLPESDDSPLSNTTEEKTETGGANTLSEYLHHIDELSQLDPSSQQHNCSRDVAVYVAFHGETLCPPPNFILS